MITLDMTKKHIDVAITEQSFVLESGILTLQISLGAYDLTGKTITAGFSITELETGALAVADGVIQLPIYYGLLAYGTNYIQINLRQGTTLEQSPRMVLFVRNGVTTTPPSAEDATLVTYLVNLCVTATATADAVVADYESLLGEGHQLQSDLQQSITDGNTINNTLTNTTTPAATAIEQTLRETTTPAAQSIDSTLTDETIPAAQAIYSDLADPVTGATKLAGDAEASLEEAIALAGETQAQLVSTGDTQTARITAEGDTQEQRVTGEGTTQVGLVQAEGTTQIGLVEDEGDAQILLVQGEGATQIGLVQAEGTAQIALVQAELPNVRENIAELQTEVKVLEDTLNQLNPSGDAKVTVTSYDTVNSLPKNAAQAGLGIVQSGMTATNLTDGDFSATGDWTSTFATFTVSNGVASFLANAQNQNAQQALTAIATHKYYVRAYVKTTTGTTDVAIRFNDGTTSTDTATASSTAWQKVSAIITAGASGTGYVGIIDKRAASWDTIQVEKFKTVNLTAIGQQALTLPQSDAMLLDYLNGTASAVSGRVRSVNKNKINGNQDNWEQGSINASDGTSIVSTQYLRAKTFISILPNTTHIFSRDTGSGIGLFNIFLYDWSGNFLGVTSSVTISSSTARRKAKIVLQKTPSLATILPSEAILAKPQLELGTVATTYVAHQRTEQYTKPMPLYRVPNGIADTVENGRYVKRVQRYVLQSANIDELNTASSANYDAVRFVKPTDAIFYNDTATVAYHTGTLILPNFRQSPTTIADSTASVGLFRTYGNNTRFYAYVTKGTYATLAAAQTALAGTVIYYQLATPIITENVSSGTLLAYPSGTIMWEPIIADVGVYGSNLGILYTDYPIQSIEKIYKIDPITGSQLELNPATSVVASGGQTFTHPDATSGDLIFFTYYFAYNYPHGELTYSYIDSNNVVLGDDGKYYKIGFAVIGGNISLTKTEVA